MKLGRILNVVSKNKEERFQRHFEYLTTKEVKKDRIVPTIEKGDGQVRTGQDVLVQTCIYGKNRVEVYQCGNRYHWKSYLNGRKMLSSIEDFGDVYLALKDVRKCFE